jgi:putative CocE/NonD family hydrolase
MKTGHSKRSRCLRRTFILAVSALVLSLTCGALALTLSAREAAKRKSLYLTMRDGVKIAIDIWLPSDLKPGEKIPTIMRSTCYWRSYQLRPVGQFMENVGLTPDDFKEGQTWAKAGYALVLVDVRGSGASFGQWSIPWSDDEIADLGEVVDWIVAQPWSNGRVGAYGVSYDGATAEMLTMLNHPAVKAVAPQYNELDLHAHLAYPGGVLNQRFLAEWGEFHRRLGANDVCGLSKAAKVDCEQMQYLMTGVRQVDGDVDGSQVAAAVADHKENETDVFYWSQQIEYRDDAFGETGLTLSDVSPYTRRDAIEASGVPMFVWESWTDSAMVDSAIGRYLTFSNPQKVIIGPWSHGGSYHADPFLPADTPVDPSPEEQFQMLVDFFDVYLKDGGAPEPEWDITYYTLGEGAWKSTRTWPPKGFVIQTWYLSDEGSLTQQASGDESGGDEYQVDWTATTGEANRWYTSLYKHDVVYPDRAEEDEKLLTYTSAPMERDIEITGNPIVTLYVASTESDGAFHVYLEDVAPDRRVTYVTEGIMRAIHHRVSDKEPPYAALGPYHTLERDDATPLVPGAVTEIRFSLYATSVLIREGHRIRIAIAGHDASTFARYPASGTPVLAMQRNSIYASHVDLPMMERP